MIQSNVLLFQNMRIAPSTVNYRNVYDGSIIFWAAKDTNNYTKRVHTNIANNVLSENTRLAAKLRRNVAMLLLGSQLNFAEKIKME